jgi:TPR repeat protein
VKHYRKAAKLNPTDACTACGPLGQAADALVDAQQWKEAIKLFDKEFAQDPHSIHAIASRGYCELKLGRIKAAFADFERGAALDHPFSQTMLAKMYVFESSIPQDRAKAIEWATKAAAQDYEPAQQFLGFMNYMGTDKPIPSTPYC